MVDCFANYLLGIEYFDKFRYKLVDERELIEERNKNENAGLTDQAKAKAAQTHSMTSKVTIYHIPSSEIVNHVSVEDCCVNIIDTPGFGDTRGPKWDEKIFKMIAGLLMSIESLDYVLLVVKSSDNRLDEQEKYIYN